MTSSVDDDSYFSMLSERLDHFVIHFDKDLETRLVSIHSILEGDSKKSGKITDIAENVAGGIVSEFGFKTEKSFDYVASMVKKPIKAAGEMYQIKRAKELLELAYDFHENKAKKRKQFVEIGVAIFKSYEMQFMRVTAKQDYKNAMRKLAEDAAYRILNRVRGKPELELKPEFVICSQSKAKTILGVTDHIGIKTAGYTVTYNYETYSCSWNTALMYQESGVVVEKNDSTPNLLYYRKKIKMEPEEYGYRRQFSSEDSSELDSEYNHEPEPSLHFQYKYIASSEFYKDQIEIILKKINNNDKGLDSERNIKLINEIMDGLKKLNKLNSEDIKEVENIPIVESIENHITMINDHFRKEKTVFEVKEMLSEIKETTKQKILPNTIPKSPVKFSVFKPSKYFTGRQNELNVLHKYLTGGEDAVAVITGLGGIGKTELSRQYMHENLNFYKNIVVINAETTETTIQSFIDLAIELNILVYNERDEINNQNSDHMNKIERKCDEQNKETSEPNIATKVQRPISCIVNDVYKYFNEEVNTLFVFDNVKEYKGITECIPKEDTVTKKPYILITSRNRNWKVGQLGNVREVRLDNFTEEEAVAYVKKSLDGVEKDEKSIQTLTSRLQYLPLALKQAVGYINQENGKIFIKLLSKRFSVKDYLVLYHAQTVKLLSAGPYENEDFCNQTVMITWFTTLEKIVSDMCRSKVTLDSFKMMAFDAPN